MIIGAVAMALIVGTVVLSRVAWRKQVGRYIITLTSHHAAIASALKTAESVMAVLSQGDEEQLIAFTQPDSEDRRILKEIAERMRIESGELKDIALPKSLWALADVLLKAADLMTAQAAAVGEAEGEAVLDALLVLDLATVRGTLADASIEAERVSRVYRVTDPSVYGGGLYI